MGCTQTTRGGGKTAPPTKNQANLGGFPMDLGASGTVHGSLMQSDMTQGRHRGYNENKSGTELTQHTPSRTLVRGTPSGPLKCNAANRTLILWTGAS